MSEVCAPSFAAGSIDNQPHFPQGASASIILDLDDDTESENVVGDVQLEQVRVAPLRLRPRYQVTEVAEPAYLRRGVVPVVIQRLVVARVRRNLNDSAARQDLEARSEGVVQRGAHVCELQRCCLRCLRGWLRLPLRRVRSDEQIRRVSRRHIGVER